MIYLYIYFIYRKQPSSVFKNHLHDHVVIFSIGHTHPLKGKIPDFLFTEIADLII